MVREDVLGEDRLAVARDRVHAVDGHAVADHRERVAGEVEVRHGGDDHLGGLGDEVHERVRLVRVQLGEVDALHRLEHEVEVVGIVVVEVVVDDLLVALGADARLLDELLEELLAQLGVLVEHLGHEPLEVDDLHAVVAKGLGEGVVLLLGHLQKRDVVEQSSRPGRCNNTFFKGLISLLTFTPAIATLLLLRFYAFSRFSTIGTARCAPDVRLTGSKSHGSGQIATTKTKQNRPSGITACFFGERFTRTLYFFIISSNLLLHGGVNL